MQYNDPDTLDPDTGLYEPAYAPLWQECFCISKNPPEFQRVDYEDLPEDLKFAKDEFCRDSGSFCPFPAFAQVIRFNSPTVSIFLY